MMTFLRDMSWGVGFRLGTLLDHKMIDQCIII